MANLDNKQKLFEMFSKLNPDAKVDKFLVKEAETDKWMQDLKMKPGKLHKKLGIPEDKKIPISVINSKIKEIHSKYKDGQKMSAEDRKFIRELELAKRFKEVAKKRVNEGSEVESTLYKARLEEISEVSNKIYELLSKENDLPSWVQDKITESHENLIDILSWLHNKEEEAEYNNDIEDDIEG